MSRLVLKDIIIGVAVIMFILFMFGCRATKDRKAKDRVLSTPELLEQVGREWEKNHPCVNDTVFGKSDTIENIHTKIEYLTDLDTLIVTEPGKVHTVVKTITRTITIRDTAVVEDTRRLNIANDSAKYYKFMYQRNEQIIEQHKKDKKDLSTSAGWAFNALVRRWWFWLLVLLIAGFLTRKLWMPRVPFLNR
jgi:flagellar biosynthesis/type III secretory pathway M-ring protein FliF/YscJ